MMVVVVEVEGWKGVGEVDEWRKKALGKSTGGGVGLGLAHLGGSVRAILEMAPDGMDVGLAKDAR